MIEEGEIPKEETVFKTHPYGTTGTTTGYRVKGILDRKKIAFTKAYGLETSRSMQKRR